MLINHFPDKKHHKKKHSSSSSSSSSSSDSDCDEYAPGEEPKAKYVCDDDIMHIKCKRGMLIHILWANYGRTCDDKCTKKARGDTTNTNCTNAFSSQHVGYK